MNTNILFADLFGSLVLMTQYNFEGGCNVTGDHIF